MQIAGECQMYKKTHARQIIHLKIEWDDARRIDGKYIYDFIEYTEQGVRRVVSFSSDDRRSQPTTAQWKRTEATEQGSLLFFFVGRMRCYWFLTHTQTQAKAKATKAGVRAHRAHFILNAGISEEEYAYVMWYKQKVGKRQVQQCSIVYLNQFSQWTPIKITFEVNNNNNKKNKQNNNNKQADKQQHSLWEWACLLFYVSNHEKSC